MPRSTPITVVLVATGAPYPTTFTVRCKNIVSLAEGPLLSDTVLGRL